MDELVKGNVWISWAELGEGLSGDYEPSDPEDVELLRFDVDRLVNGEWQPVDDASYCTQVPVSATANERKKGLEMLMSELFEPVTRRVSVKKLCERLSWISLPNIRQGVLPVSLNRFK